MQTAFALDFPPRPANDMADVRDQESAKRLLEIAAIGGHSVALYGDADVIAALVAAFPGIGGSPEQFQPDGDMKTEIRPEPEWARILPSGECSATILSRVVAAREALTHVSDQLDAHVQAFIADAHRHFSEEQIAAAKRIARSVAAGDGDTTVKRIHMAEALSYVMGGA